ncbi:MAG: VOC family protein [Erysipelotrichaceae bacterium]|nr:VOC family protein [Erysipelotrichaceae bacterium]
MKIDHFALYVKDIEAARRFFIKYFDAQSNEMYHNPRTGFSSYFLTFEGGSRLEIMNKPDLKDKPESEWYGFIHLAMNVGSREKVDELTKRLMEDGYERVSGPRTTGDGYYESCIRDGEGNLIEITI